MPRSLNAHRTAPGGPRWSGWSGWHRAAPVAVLATTLCGSAFGHADNARQAATQPTVIMMVGGVTPSYRDSASTDTSAPAASSGRLSVVIQPGIGPPSATFANESTSPSVASRVLAFAPLIDEAARAADLDSALLMAVVDVESGGDPQAVSPKGAAGLMQVMPDTGARHGATNLFDPRQNLAAGARYLRRLIRQFGDLSLALAAYNAGEGAVQKYDGQIPPYAETMRYVPKVMGRYHRYRETAQDITQDAPQNAGAPARSGLAPPAPDVAHGRFLLVRGNRGMDQAIGE